MERSGADSGAGRAAKHEGNCRAGAVAALRGEVRDHVERTRDEIHELELHDRTESRKRRAHPNPGEPLLADGGVEYPLRSEVIEEAVRQTEGAAVESDVFAEQDHPGIAFHLRAQRPADGLEVGDGHGVPGCWRRVSSLWTRARASSRTPRRGNPAPPQSGVP